MARDFEDRLRQSLQARAEDVTPDPSLYGEVQSRIRRGRMMRWSLAGAGAVAMVAIGVLVFPTLTDRRVKFEPAPVATQPPTEPAEEPAAAPPCNDDGDALVAVVARTDGDLHARCSSGAEEPLTAVGSDDGVEDSPALSPDGRLLAYVVREDHEIPPRVEVFDLAANELVETIDNATSPAYSSAGHLAFVRDTPGDGEQPRLIVREPGRENESSMSPDIPEELTARHLVWGDSPTPRILYWEAHYEGTTVWGDDYIEPGAWRFDVVGDGNYATPSSRQEGKLHVLRTCCVELEGDPAESVELGALTLPDTQATFEPIMTLPRSFDATGTLSLAAAGTADIDETTGQWTSGGALAWLVGDGDRLYLVDDDGNTDVVDDGVLGVAFNPAAELPAGAPSRSEDPSPPGTHVKVYFAHGECGQSVRAYQRSVQDPAVLRGALEQLLAGPTAEEIDGGAQSGFSDETADALNGVTIADNGVARVDFADFSDRVFSTSCMTGAMFAQLEPTLRQFQNVEEVVYSFDGSIEDFYTAYELVTPPHRPDIPLPVTRMQQRIIEALVHVRQDGDYDALAELIDRETFSCSFSDANEDCIALWQQQEAEGQDPLGSLWEILGDEPIKNPDAPMWVWPQQWLTDDEYLGPRTGIQRDGTWRYYQQGGD